MKIAKEEKGYAALVAILVILLLTIIGTNLLSTVMSSLVHVRKTESRGEAEYFARMGMDEAMARLSKAIEEVNEQVASHPDWTMAPSDSIASTYQTILDSHFPIGANQFQTVTGPNGEQWLTSEPVTVDSGINGSYEIMVNRKVIRSWQEDSPYVERFLIRVIGKSTSVIPETKVLEAKVYVNTYPGEFHYVLSSPGPITVNGAAYVEGDAYADSFTLWDHAEYFYNGVTYEKHTAQPTSYPAFVGTIGVPYTTQEDLRNNRFFAKDETGDSPSNFDPDVKDITSDWYKRFSMSPRLSLTMKPDFNLDDMGGIAAIVDKKASFTVALPFIKDPFPRDPEINQRFVEVGFNSEPIKENSIVVEGGLLLKDNATLESVKDVEVNGTLFMEKNLDGDKSLATLKADRIYIHGDSSSNSASTSLSGNLEVGSYIYIRGDAVIQDLHFTGKMYIDGNLTIQGNFDMNGTIYVNGTVDITEEDASANWDPKPDSTVVILSSGKIEAYNLNLFNDTPRKMHAFLYSEQDMTLYGIGSNMTFIGGLHGRSITLNAVKGTVNDLGSGTLSIQSQEGLKPKDSRLKILFNPALYESPPPGLPTSRTVSITTVSYELDTFDADHAKELSPALR